MTHSFWFNKEVRCDTVSKSESFDGPILPSYGYEESMNPY